MSLIADALDAAQRERAKRSGIRQTVLTDSPSSFRSTATRTKPAIPREVGIALAGFAAVVVIASAVTILTAKSRNGVRPISAATVAAPIPMPVQTPTGDAPLGVASGDTGFVREAPQTTGFDAYDRVIAEYDPVTSPRTFATRPQYSASVDDLAPPAEEEEDAPAARPVSKGSFKITMQPATPAPVTDRQFQQGLAAQQRGDFVAARNFYNQSLSGNPGNAETLNNLGAVYRSLGDLKSAEDSYRRALKLDPKLAAAWSNLAVVLDAQGKRQDATAALQESLRLDPRNVSTKVNLAIQFSALALYAEARHLLEDVLRDNPTLAEAHYTLGQVLERQGDREKAGIEFKAFLATSRGRFPKQELQVRQHLKDLGIAN